MRASRRARRRCVGSRRPSPARTRGGRRRPRTPSGRCIAGKAPRRALPSSRRRIVQAAPHERVRASQRRSPHSLADRLEDLGLAEVRDQKPEREGARGRLRRLDVRARSGPPLHQPGGCRSRTARPTVMRDAPNWRTNSASLGRRLPGLPAARWISRSQRVIDLRCFGIRRALHTWLNDITTLTPGIEPQEMIANSALRGRRIADMDDCA